MSEVITTRREGGILEVTLDRQSQVIRPGLLMLLRLGRIERCLRRRRRSSPAGNLWRLEFDLHPQLAATSDGDSVFVERESIVAAFDFDVILARLNLDPPMVVGVDHVDLFSTSLH